MKNVLIDKLSELFSNAQPLIVGTLVGLSFITKNNISISDRSLKENDFICIMVEIQSFKIKCVLEHPIFPEIIELFKV